MSKQKKKSTIPFPSMTHFFPLILAQIYVDDQLVWSRSVSWRDSTSLGRLCGNPTFTEHMVPVVIDLPSHVGTTLTLKINSTLDTGATDESFGIANVRVGPMVPHWPAIDMFDGGSAFGWEASPATSSRVQTCGIEGPVFGSTNGNANSKLTKGELVSCFVRQYLAAVY